MPLFFRGKLVNVGTNSFKGDSGDEVSYYINTIAHEQGVLTVNSKADFSDFLNEDPDVTLMAREQNATDPKTNRNVKLYKLSLSQIQPVIDGRNEKESTIT